MGSGFIIVICGFLVDKSLLKLVYFGIDWSSGYCLVND